MLKEECKKFKKHHPKRNKINITRLIPYVSKVHNSQHTVRTIFVTVAKAKHQKHHFQYYREGHKEEVIRLMVLGLSF